MAQIAKIFAGRAQNILQAAAKQPQLAPRFYSAAGKYIMIDFFIVISNWIFFCSQPTSCYAGNPIILCKTDC